MDTTPFYKRPWFYIIAWLAVLLAFYGWQIFAKKNDIWNVLADLACIFPALLLLWTAFFAQFVLPVRTIRDRQKIFDRLLANLFGSHGPAMFIRNGTLIKRVGEEKEKGPGVLWLDSASAAVTRTPVRIKQILGPGVHFIDSGEFVAGTLDLHIQTQSIGLRETDNPFEERGENMDNEEYDEVQDRRRTVSALTRDGIEVIPSINISFRVDTGFPKEGEPGSRFGYRTGTTKKSRQKEAEDKEAIRKAILGEGVNPNITSDPTRRRVAWNELPASLAVDVWREYVSRFTLDELFKPEQFVPPPPLEIPQPTDEEIDPLTQAVSITASQTSWQNRFTLLLREVNVTLSRIIRRLEGGSNNTMASASASSDIPKSSPHEKREPTKKTALQVVNDMVNARLEKPEVDILDDDGRRGLGVVPSQEYQLLKNRGISVLSVNIGNLRLNPVIEETIINRWSASWHENAEAERKQIERRQNVFKSSGQEKATRQYAERLSMDLARKKPFGVKETLKTLLMRTRTIIVNDDQLRRDMNEEQQALDDILRWVEENE
jgi:regulator of protease activity HflC (stomatin/prohibitin superfamily)